MNMKLHFKWMFFLFFLLLLYTVSAQDPLRFKEDIEKLVLEEHFFTGDKELVVFAGSSSIRMWKDIRDYFPDYHVINNGFGGSHFSDLIYYYEELILKHNPDYLFIYEGDNDIAGNKHPKKIVQDAKELHQRIRKDLPGTRVVFISPKPSIKRENLKKEYQKLNKRLERYCKNKQNTGFANVWAAMVDEKGDVFPDIFLEDDLHMNKKGYDIWAEVIAEFLD
jgi:lysophospholipase L1-like esterase